MTKVDLADIITEEVERQEQEPKPELIGKEPEIQDLPETKPKKTRTRAKLKKNEPEPEAEAEPVARQSTWVTVDQFDRLDALKIRQKKRLKQEGKRASVQSLIEEAIEQYLKKME